MAYSPTQLANGNFPPDDRGGDIRNGAATAEAGPAVSDTTHTATGTAAVAVAMGHLNEGLDAVNVSNMSNAGTHAAG